MCEAELATEKERVAEAFMLSNLDESLQEKCPSMRLEERNHACKVFVAFLGKLVLMMTEEDPDEAKMAAFACFAEVMGDQVSRLSTTHKQTILGLMDGFRTLRSGFSGCQ
jgi:hypothetical protein